MVCTVGGLSAGMGTGGKPRGALIATTSPIGLSLPTVRHPTLRIRIRIGNPARRTKCRLETFKLGIIITLALLQDDVRTHHVVSFVLLHMTVPEIASWISIKRNVNARDHVGRALDDIFPPLLIRIGRCCG